MADAPALGAGGSNPMRVRPSPSAPSTENSSEIYWLPSLNLFFHKLRYINAFLQERDVFGRIFLESLLYHFSGQTNLVITTTQLQPFHINIRWSDIFQALHRIV